MHTQNDASITAAGAAKIMSADPSTSPFSEGDRVSLSPLSPEDALRALLATPRLDEDSH